MAQEAHREHWGSRIGFILAAAGSAVGLGNIWRFPYITGKYGGAAFVLVYLALIFIVGFSVMLAEMAIGRKAQLNAVGSFQKLRGGAWPIVGWMGVLAGFMILSFYGVIGGWTIKYFIWSFTGLMGDAAAGKAGDVFGAFVTNTPQVIMYQAIFMLITIWVVYKGIGEGIEKYCKILMPALFVILLILIVRSVTLEGAGKGLEFYLKPDFSKLTGESFAAALGQAFFSLSLGMGCMITYGSYVDKQTTLPGAAIQVCVIDTMVAILAGLAIFPAVFAFGVDAGAGPGLTFVTLPSVFAKMAGSSIWSALFFLLLFIAALTSAISLLEVVAAYVIDKGWARPKAAVIMGLLIFALGVPSAMSLTGAPKIAGKDFLDAMDFLSSNVLLPLGGVFIALFVGWFWTADARREVTNEGTHSFGMMEPWIWVCRVIAPLGILYIFITGLKW
ncbi:MAG TPA: sodium-dependent transporter [Aminivibrio sp.]|uniref:sodium-dependent transporter n=1 Tax=Aminivibrio sp. TaxID=1872489 RepID=UPI002CDF3235|nr:sodium-dependent transporter [Aminivibrio sp.]NCB14900.1 sodium-dependent transporter [Synergistales bacterium]HPF85286.1 sodium-dependent transporter [Aminivibrio sp.]